MADEAAVKSTADEAEEYLLSRKQVLMQQFKQLGKNRENLLEQAAEQERLMGNVGAEHDHLHALLLKTSPKYRTEFEKNNPPAPAPVQQEAKPAAAPAPQADPAPTPPVEPPSAPTETQVELPVAPVTAA